MAYAETSPVAHGQHAPPGRTPPGHRHATPSPPQLVPSNHAVDLAEELIAQIAPDGKQASTTLRRLLALKDDGQYGLFDVGGEDLRAALRQATALVQFATDVLQR